MSVPQEVAETLLLLVDGCRDVASVVVEFLWPLPPWTLDVKASVWRDEANPRTHYSCLTRSGSCKHVYSRNSLGAVRLSVSWLEAWPPGFTADTPADVHYKISLTGHGGLMGWAGRAHHAVPVLRPPLVANANTKVPIGWVGLLGSDGRFQPPEDGNILRPLGLPEQPSLANATVLIEPAWFRAPEPTRPTTLIPWGAKKLYHEGQEVDHNGQRYRFLLPSFLLQSKEQEPDYTVKRPPQWQAIIFRGPGRAQMQNRDLNNHWRHLGPSGVPYCNEPPGPARELLAELLVLLEIQPLAELAVAYIWAPTPWTMAVNLSYCHLVAAGRVFEDSELRLAWCSMDCVRSSARLGELSFSVVPDPNLSYGAVELDSPDHIVYQLSLINKRAGALLVGTARWYCESSERSSPAPEKRPVEWAAGSEQGPEAAGASWIDLGGELEWNGHLRVHGLGLVVDRLPAFRELPLANAHAPVPWLHSSP